MTTIACNKEEIACDLQFTDVNTGQKWKGKGKVFYFEPSVLHYPHSSFYVGFAGTAKDMITVADYFSMPEEYEELPKLEGNLLGMVLTAKKEIFVFDDYRSWLPVDAKFHAIGSGAQTAVGALECGKTPKQAIQTAMKHDSYTGYGVKSFRFK